MPNSNKLAQIGSSVQQPGRTRSRQKRHERALMIYKKIFSEHHACIVANYHNLALIYNHLGEYNQAKELSKKTLMIRKKIMCM